MIETAVIMAAGKGTRFGDRTESMPKGFIPFHGIPMVVRSIETLIRCGIKKIIIGTGYHKEWYDRLAETYPQIVTVFSADYADTNSMETLSVCREAIGSDDFLLLESDIVYESRAITALTEDPRPDLMLVSPVTKFQDQYYIGSDGNGNLSCCSVVSDEIKSQTGTDPVGELIGIHKLSTNYYRELLDLYDSKTGDISLQKDPRKIGYEFYLEDVAKLLPLGLTIIESLQWYEIDDIADLAYAEENIRI